jgi:hypothetical protein
LEQRRQVIDSGKSPRDTASALRMKGVKSMQRFHRLGALAIAIGVVAVLFLASLSWASGRANPVRDPNNKGPRITAPLVIVHHGSNGPRVRQVPHVSVHHGINGPNSASTQ